MRKNIALTALLLSLLLLFCACGADKNDTPDTTDNTTDTIADVATDTSEADTSNDTTDTSDITDEPSLTLPTEADWEAIRPSNYSWSDTYRAIVALLSNDIDTFAHCCSVSPEVYESLRGMVITDYKLSSEEIFYVSNARPFPILEIEVAESNSEFFTVGTHKLVFDEGLVLRFIKYDEFLREGNGSQGESSEFQFAASYIHALGSDRDFQSISAEGQRQFGLCDFIVSRLNKLAGNYEPRSEQEIRDYAEKYLGVDGDTLYIDQTLEKYEGGYQAIGRGKGSYPFTVLSEEVIDGVNVVTVRFFADFSQTVTSRVVEFHMELIDGEYRPIKSVIIEDTEFESPYVST